MKAWWIPMLAWALGFGGVARGQEESLKVAVEWGHRSPANTGFILQFLTEGDGMRLWTVAYPRLEPGDAAHPRGTVGSRAGGGVFGRAELELRFPARTVTAITNVHSIWRHLLEHSDAGTAARLQSDPGYRPDPRRLTVSLGADGTSGFSLTVDQMRAQRAFWVPEFDVFVSVGEPGIGFEEHQRTLEPLRGRRVRDQVAARPEASYAEYAAAWEDMGSPGYRNPHQVGPGHLVGVTWDSAIPKFGVDRVGGIWSDYGNPDRFRLRLGFAEVNRLPVEAWRGQRLVDGLPVVRTVLEREGVRWETEALAYPLDGPPVGRRGEIGMVLLQKVTVVNLGDTERSLAFELVHERSAGPTEVLLRDGVVTLETTDGGGTLLTVGGAGLRLTGRESPGPGTNVLNLGIELGGRGVREFVVKLPSPVVPAGKRGTLLALDYAEARRRTLEFWSGWLERGARFEVPERVVNDLFRANLWHALRLPRRHGDEGGAVRLDLPYSNFAYDQKGTPWPVNQAVYVDAMLYDLRGYHAVAEEELAAMFRGNQEPDGRVGGFANWGVYTPSMVYAVARNFRLSGDRAAFERLRPAAGRAMDWCLRRIGAAADGGGSVSGLVLAPLNDLTHAPRAWAFNQAYLFAAADEMARALSVVGDPREADCRRAAGGIAGAVEREFGRASVRSPLVPLRDGTWMPYVPGDALTPGRMLEVWYPTDVDTGPLHLARLGAIHPSGLLATAMLHDHEDNLFLGGLGMANEPVYNQHATAWLVRDDVPMVVRSFYSMLACAFSQSTLEPVEHRWGWGQYFGPPSTDGAWFELYRNMLVREPDDDTLWLCQATPRAWWQAGRRIRVERAPTLFGPVSFEVTSEVDRGLIRATIELPTRRAPRTIQMRFRHPEDRWIQSATVNGRPWAVPGRELAESKGSWLVIDAPTAARYEIVVRYE